MCTGTHDYIPVSNVAKVEFFQRLESQQLENVLYIQKASAWSESTLQTLVDTLHTWWVAFVTECQDQNLTYVGAKATDLGSESGPVAEVAPFEAVPGQLVTGSPLPAHNAVVISWKTQNRGRSYRGRTYLGGLSSASIIGSNVGSSLQQAINNAITELNTVLGTNSWGHVVVSLCNNNAWRTTGVATPITSYSINPVVASQRRRLPGRGA